MANRLTKIITRTGDDGSTGLGNGSRISKDNPRIAAIGEIDELNSALGLLLCEELPEEIRVATLGIQNDLFDLGSQLSVPERQFIKEEQILHLEELATRFNSRLPPLKEFILPGGARAAALAQFCRAVCRRAERTLVLMMASEPVTNNCLRYLNRLSDLLFIIGRSLNQAAGQAEIYWQKNKPLT